MHAFVYYHRKRAAITSLFLYSYVHFYTTFYQNIHQNADHVFKIFSGSLNTPYSMRAGKIISFYIKMVMFGIILIKKHLIKIYTKTHQIAPFFKFFSEDLALEHLCHAQHSVSRHAYI